jgi:hypothetical protein
VNPGDEVSSKVERVVDGGRDAEKALERRPDPPPVRVRPVGAWSSALASGVLPTMIKGALNIG